MASFASSRFPYPCNLNLSNFVTLKLSASNFILWQTQFLSLVETQDLLGFLSGEIVAPTSEIELPDGQRIDNPDYVSWVRTDSLVKAWITATLSEEVLGLAVGFKTSANLWKTLSAAFSQAREFDLLSELHFLKKTDSMSLSDFLFSFKSICDQLNAIGKPVPDQRKVFLLLTNLGPAYESFAISMLKPPVLSYSDVIPRLQIHDLRSKNNQMDPKLYVYAATSEGNLDFHQLQSQLDNELTPQENTALHVASKFGQTERVKEIHSLCPKLLRRKNSNDETALHLAARNGHPDIVKFLIEQDQKQRTLPQQQEEDIELGRRGSTEEVAVETDNEESSLIRMTNKKKDTALHEAVRNHFHLHGEKETEYLEVVKLLTEADPEFEYFANEASETPLYIAAEEGLYDFVVQLLRTCSSSLEYGGPFGTTALHAAIYGHHSGMTRRLLEWKPDLIRRVDTDGWSPLHYAVYCGSLEMVKLLLEHDRSVAYLPDNEGISPIHMAAQKYSLDNRVLFTELMLQCPDCLELVDKEGRNPLHFLAMNISADFMLVAKEGMWLKYMTNEVDNDGNTILHIAAQFNNQLVASQIFNFHFTDTLAMNNNFLTALDIAQKEQDPTEAATWSTISKKWKKKSPVRSRVREAFKEEAEAGKGKIKDDKNKMDEPKKEERSSNDVNLVVATLIATMTFAAGFTVPGGYNSSSPDAGAAILAKTTAFKAFLISNSAAMVFAVTAVFLHFWATLYQGLLVEFDEMFRKLGGRLIVLATSSMVTAFMTGTYAVLPTSHGLAVAVCTISSTFFLSLAICLLTPFIVPSLMAFTNKFMEWADKLGVWVDKL